MCKEKINDMTNDKNHGGRREGSGRRDLGRSVAVTVRISPEAKALLDTVANKSEWVDEMVKKQLGKKK